MLNFQSPAFLRRVLLADGIMGIAMGLILIGTAGTLEPLLGLPASLLREAGLVLLPLGAFVAWTGSRAQLSRRLVWTVIACNAVWAADSFLLLASGWVSPTALGQAFVVGQALVVAAFAELEFFGLRGIRALGAGA